MNVNWSNQFNVDITAQGMTLFPLNETTCVFDMPGSGVDLPIGGCTDDSQCIDGRECTVNRCNVNTNRCKPAIPINEGGSCDPGDGVSPGVCTVGSCFYAD